MLAVGRRGKEHRDSPDLQRGHGVPFNRAPAKQHFGGPLPDCGSDSLDALTDSFLSSHRRKRRMTAPCPSRFAKAYRIGLSLPSGQRGQLGERRASRFGQLVIAPASEQAPGWRWRQSKSRECVRRSCATGGERRSSISPRPAAGRRRRRRCRATTTLASRTEMPPGDEFERERNAGGERQRVSEQLRHGRASATRAAAGGGGGEQDLGGQRRGEGLHHGREADPQAGHIGRRCAPAPAPRLLSDEEAGTQHRQCMRRHQERMQTVRPGRCSRPAAMAASIGARTSSATASRAVPLMPIARGTPPRHRR